MGPRWSIQTDKHPFASWSQGNKFVLSCMCCTCFFLFSYRLIDRRMRKGIHNDYSSAHVQKSICLSLIKMWYDEQGHIFMRQYGKRHIFLNNILPGLFIMCGWLLWSPYHPLNPNSNPNTQMTFSLWDKSVTGMSDIIEYYSYCNADYDRR